MTKESKSYCYKRIVTDLNRVVEMSSIRTVEGFYPFRASLVRRIASETSEKEVMQNLYELESRGILVELRNPFSEECKYVAYITKAVDESF